MIVVDSIRKNVMKPQVNVFIKVRINISWQLKFLRPYENDKMIQR